LSLAAKNRVIRQSVCVANFCFLKRSRAKKNPPFLQGGLEYADLSDYALTDFTVLIIRAATL
jgi:hypothetical protein